MISWTDYACGVAAGVFLTGFAQAMISWHHAWRIRQKQARDLHTNE